MAPIAQRTAEPEKMNAKGTMKAERSQAEQEQRAPKRQLTLPWHDAMAGGVSEQVLKDLPSVHEPPEETTRSAQGMPRQDEGALQTHQQPCVLHCQLQQPTDAQKHNCFNHGPLEAGRTEEARDD